VNERTKLKEHLNNLLNALTNISPARNLISQLILLLPRDLMTIENSFPEFNDPLSREILDILGVEFNEQVKRRGDSFADALYKHLHKLFDWLNNEDVRINIAKLTDLPIISIPNPYAEWARNVLNKFKQMPNGSKILKFIDKLLSRENFLVDRYGYSRGAYAPDWPIFLAEVSKELKLNPAELEEILKLTVRVPGFSELISSKGSSYYADVERLEHSEYHLDLIVSREYRDVHGRYDFMYKVRYRKTLKELLEELSHD